MRWKFFGAGVGVALVSSAVLAQQSAPLFATMTANQPLVAAWLSAPPGTATSMATVPAGALQASSYTLEAGDPSGPRVRLVCARTAPGPSWLVLGLYLSALQPQELVATQADVTFRIAAPVGTVLSVRVGAGSLDGGGDGNALWVDVDDDGTIDFDSRVAEGRALTRVAGVVPLAIRVRSNWIAQAFDRYAGQILVEPWHPAAQPAGDGCGNLATAFVGSWPSTTNYQMAATATDHAGSWLELRAYGHGDVGWFVFDLQPAAVPVSLPAPWSQRCPLLANPLVAVPAGIASAAPFWARMFVPFLPPGQVVYVQHAAFGTQPPYPSGTSNRIRLQS